MRIERTPPALNEINSLSEMNREAILAQIRAVAARPQTDGQKSFVEQDFVRLACTYDAEKDTLTVDVTAE